MQGYLQTNLIVYLSQVVGFIGAMSVVALVVGFIGAMSLFRLLSDLLGDVGGCTCCRIYWAMSVFTLVVGFIGQCWRECRRHDTPAKPRV